MVSLTKDVCRRFSIRWGLVVLGWAWIGLVGPVHAQLSNFTDPLGGKVKPTDAAKASFIASLTPSTAKPGDEVTLTVSAKLPPQSYIYATSGDFGGRTRITVTKLEGLEQNEAEFEPDRKPETKFDPGLNETLAIFHDDVAWSKKFRLESAATPEKVAIDLKLEGQYCSNGPGGQCHLIRHGELRATLVAAARDQIVPAKAEQEVEQKPTVPFKFSMRPKKGKRSPVEVKVELAPVKATNGKTVILAVTMVMDEGWHTFSTTFKGGGGTATEISLEKIHGLKSITEYFVPNRAAEIKVEPELKLTQEVYHHSVTWLREFEIIPGSKPNAYGVEGSISYQTCERVCLPPITVNFSVGVTGDDVEPPATVETYEGPAIDVSLAPQVAPSEDQGAGQPAADQVPHNAGDDLKPVRPQDKGLLYFVFTAVVAGIFALLTPCVFPMVPITVSFFLKQSEGKNGRPIVLALIFSISIILAFVVIGVGVAALFGATKPNELANNWILNLFLATIFFAFALNMLGLFEIQMPTWLLNFTSSGEQTGGYIGVVFMALTFVLTSFSCTFAFVGSLLATAAQGQYYWPILGMVAFGGTFAAPFFCLAMMPGALKSLPKSGGWLNSVKVVMGFVEIGVAVKYISIVDQQWFSIPWIFDFSNVMALWSALSVCTGLYLLGIFRMTHDSPLHGLSPIRVLLAVGFMVLGGLFAVGLTQPERDSWLINQLVAFAPARLGVEEVELDFDKAVEVASIKGDRPLFVDFTGVNCTNCRQMEIKMVKPHNKRLLEKLIPVQLYLDSVPRNLDTAEQSRLIKRNTALEIEWLDDVTMPAYAVVTPDGKTVLSTFIGNEVREGDFAKFLDTGLKKWQAVRPNKL